MIGREVLTLIPGFHLVNLQIETTNGKYDGNKGNSQTLAAVITLAQRRHTGLV